MFNIIQCIIQFAQEPSSDVIRMIRSEYKNTADQEFALRFFNANKKLPDLTEFYYG